MSIGCAKTTSGRVIMMRSDGRAIVPLRSRCARTALDVQARYRRDTRIQSAAMRRAEDRSSPRDAPDAHTELRVHAVSALWSD